MRQIPLLSALATVAALPVLADEVNVYSHRQPELVQPLFDAFTKETGIEVNVAFVDKGMVERLQAEGDRSPADLVMTVDIARLSQIVDAGVKLGPLTLKLGQLPVGHLQPRLKLLLFALLAIDQQPLPDFLQRVAESTPPQDQRHARNFPWAVKPCAPLFLR